ncbi:shufflon system plasmid conjugative transfer pilus tip adhesin PilV [Citrobacter freundii]|jgi:hypothetical protein|uniref:shufflon system plasmid conjugative transfer pilus tip adhesin PilV n=1 Tax=Citrobacter TaxID=544 RepID=UPI0009459FF8|nr:MULTISPECIES: shufflon system plasmid conjugative transfer pilus tip adhesin PilV [Citrobacter]MBA7999412.1 shufflon system plasmid conjugative transfer pilus tip adhesin PilV [Citrobacter freundii]
MKSNKKGIMQVTDAQIGWGMALIGVVFAGVAYGYYADDNSYSVAAQHAQRVSEAADKYISDNFDSIVAQSSATKVFVFDITTLKNAGYLPSSFNATNSFSQTYRGMVLQPTVQKLQTLIVTTGGVNLSTGKANKIGIRIGANGGYIESGNAVGSQGSWSEPLSKYSFNPGDGHIAIAQFFKDGVSGNDFLYRKAVSGHPELNAMSTNLSLGGNDINSAKNITASGLINTTNATVTNNITSANASVTNNLTATNASINNLNAGTTRTSGETYTGGWFRTTGDTGWYSEKWGGGFHMTDSSYIRAYNGKSIYTSGQVKAGSLRSDGDASVAGIITLDKISVVGTSCPVNGALSRDDKGSTLSCQSGVWRSARSDMESFIVIGASGCNKNYSYAACPAGNRLLSGGYNLTYFSGNASNAYNAPDGSYPDIVNNRWVVTGAGSNNNCFAAYAMCLR